MTVTPTDSTKNITWIYYQLNQNSNITLTERLNISSDMPDPDGILNETLISHANLSQSFVPNQLMEVRNISIRVKRTGLPNATLQVRPGSDSPSDTVLANFSIDNSSVSSAGFSWVGISLNYTVTLQGGTRYWLFLSPNGSQEDYYEWEASDNNISAGGYALQNTSRDLLFRIFDFYRYRAAITVSEGENNLTVYANNSDSQVAGSSIISFTLDTVPPVFTGINESSDLIEIGNNIIISVNASDASTAVNKAIFELNRGTNYTMVLDTGTRYNITFQASVMGVNNYTFYVNDSLGNLNISSSFNFTVADSSPPMMSGISNSPSTEDGLDPDVPVNVTATITDFGNVSSAALQYKLSTDLDWTNASMQNSANLYFGNFTPSSAGNWSYRLWANDSSGNANFSANSTLNISLDYSWTRTPASLGAMSGIKGNEVVLGNITINNTADFALGFDITLSQSFASINKTAPFTIAAGGHEVIRLNATAPLVEAEYTITATIDAQNATASPASLQANVTLASISSGPYLFIEILQYNASVSTGDFIDLIAKISNIGNETATNVESNWTLPSGWTSIPADNKTLGSIAVNKFEYHNISADITSDAAGGTKAISVYAVSAEGANNTASKTVVVSANATAAPAAAAAGSSGSGGGGSGSSGGGGSLPAASDTGILVDAPGEIRMFPEQKKTFRIKITNNVSGAVSGAFLENIKVSVNGFLLTKMEIIPAFIKKIGHKESAIVNFTIDVPKYMNRQNRTLILAFAGNVTELDRYNNTRNRRSFEKKVVMSLLIIEATKDSAMESVSSARESIESLKQAGINTAKLEQLLAGAVSSLEEEDYKEAIGVSRNIIDLKEKAMEVSGTISETSSRIQGAEARGVDVGEAKQLLGLAMAEFNAGNFLQAEEYVNRALVAERLSSKTEEANMLRSLLRFFTDNWLSLLAILFVAAVAGQEIMKRRSVGAVSEMIKMLRKQEESIIGLMKKAQSQYFVEKLMSERVYGSTMKGHVRHMAELQKEMLRLNSRKIRLLKKMSDVSVIAKEKIEIGVLMKELQYRYFVSKTITREAYEVSMAEYRKRMAELEQSLKAAEEKSAGRKDAKHRVQKIMGVAEGNDEAAAENATAHVKIPAEFPMKKRSGNFRPDKGKGAKARRQKDNEKREDIQGGIPDVSDGSIGNEISREEKPVAAEPEEGKIPVLDTSLEGIKAEGAGYQKEKQEQIAQSEPIINADITAENPEIPEIKTEDIAAEDSEKDMQDGSQEVPMAEEHENEKPWGSRYADADSAHDAESSSDASSMAAESYEATKKDSIDLALESLERELDKLREWKIIR